MFKKKIGLASDLGLRRVRLFLSPSGSGGFACDLAAPLAAQLGGARLPAHQAALTRDVGELLGSEGLEALFAP